MTQKRPLNPLADYWLDKNGNRVSQAEANIAKNALFCADIHEKQAFAEDGTSVTLGADGATADCVDFVSGIWRIQNNFNYSKIVRVRDKDMILIDKLNRKENTNFEYWTAKIITYNCFGPFVFKGQKPDCIVAKYETDNGALWGYGATIESARAFLGLKLFDEYKEIIHAIACRNKLKNK